jgi:very-short-patch-repair endonuclease
VPNANARTLRRNLTDAERRLWSLLRDRRLDGHKFRRQHPVGPFILDFACVEHQLVVEADGGQHADSERDKRRDIYLRRHGWRILRFWNHDILSNSEGVRSEILGVLAADPHPPVASATGPSLSR